MSRLRRPSTDERGQGLVEFALVLIPFLFLLMGIVDLGRGIYIYNGAAQAAREIARETAMYPCTAPTCADVGSSPQTAAVIATQRRLVPGLADPAASIVITCTDITDAAMSPTACTPEDYVRVQVRIPFSVLTPLLSMVAPTTLSSTTHVDIPSS